MLFINKGMHARLQIFVCWCSVGCIVSSGATVPERSAVCSPVLQPTKQPDLNTLILEE